MKNRQRIIKIKILEEIEKTELNIKQYREQSGPISPDNAIGRVSRMDAINNKSVINAALQKAETKLKQLKIIQKKIKNGYNGICASCNNIIPIARILIVPESTKCVYCA